MKPEAGLHIIMEDDSASVILKCTGVWVNTATGNIVRLLEKCCRRVHGVSVTWDVSGIVRIDAAGMVIVIHYTDILENKGCSVKMTGACTEFDNMHQLVMKYAVPVPMVNPALSPRILQPLEFLGRAAAGAAGEMMQFLSFTGESFVTFLSSLVHPRSIRYRAIIKNIQDAGVSALPIISLTSFLIGVVIAYQGAVQLARFGGNIFIVDMIGISVTRELAPLITAIVVAGRTGSSYTAQLGVMKITEEVDAMRVMGFDPHLFLVQPRIVALMIALPLLIFFADIIGIMGGMFIADVHLNLSWIEFIHRLQNVLAVKHLWIGICKGPFFAWLIAITGCFHGFQVSRNTASIGRYTTISVVNSIFLVIACDALFSVLLTELGI